MMVNDGLPGTGNYIKLSISGAHILRNFLFHLPPSSHHLLIIHLTIGLHSVFRITMSLKWPLVPKSDVKQQFTNTTILVFYFFFHGSKCIDIFCYFLWFPLLYENIFSQFCELTFLHLPWQIYLTPTTLNYLHKLWRSKGFFNLKLSCLSYHFPLHWIPMLWVYGHYKYFNSFSARPSLNVRTSDSDI